MYSGVQFPAKEQINLELKVMIYGYVRVSTDAQDIAAQESGIKRYCAERKMEINRWVKDEGVSGAIDYEERNLGKILAKIKRNDIIVAGEISRFGRSLFMVMRFLEFCMKKEIKVYTVKDGYEWRTFNLLKKINCNMTCFKFEEEL